jgi:hypothetical protein
VAGAAGLPKMAGAAALALMADPGPALHGGRDAIAQLPGMLLSFGHGLCRLQEGPPSSGLQRGWLNTSEPFPLTQITFLHGRPN